MRTVHETEALRPSDPVPKHHSSNPQNKSQRVRLTFKGLGGPGAANANGHNDTPSKQPEAPKSAKSNVSPVPASPSTAPTIPPPDLDYDNANVVFHPTPSLSAPGDERQFPSDIHFTEWELSLSPPDLLKALKIHLADATAENSTLRQELEILEERRKTEWTAKELVLENVLESEHKILQARSGDDVDNRILQGMLTDVEPSKQLEIEAENLLWWRQGEYGASSGKANGNEAVTGLGNGMEVDVPGRGMDELGAAEQEAIGAMVKMERSGDVGMRDVPHTAAA
jgi:hypothetical protein